MHVLKTSWRSLADQQMVTGTFPYQEMSVHLIRILKSNSIFIAIASFSISTQKRFIAVSTLLITFQIYQQEYNCIPTNTLN